MSSSTSSSSSSSSKSSSSSSPACVSRTLKPGNAAAFVQMPGAINPSWRACTPSHGGPPSLQQPSLHSARQPLAHRQRPKEVSGAPSLSSMSSSSSASMSPAAAASAASAASSCSSSSRTASCSGSCAAHAGLTWGFRLQLQPYQTLLLRDSLLVWELRSTTCAWQVGSVSAAVVPSAADSCPPHPERPPGLPAATSTSSPGGEAMACWMCHQTSCTVYTWV